MNRSKQKFCISVCAAVILVFSFLYWGTRYFMGTIEESSADIVAGKKAIHSLVAKNRDLAESKKIYGNIETETAKASAAIVDKDKTVDFITEAESIARDNQVKLKITSTGEKADGINNDFVTSSGFTFRVGGSFDAVMHFLYSLENFKYEIDIENLSMEEGSFDQKDSKMIVLEFKLTLYQKNSL